MPHVVEQFTIDPAIQNKTQFFFVCIFLQQFKNHFFSNSNIFIFIFSNTKMAPCLCSSSSIDNKKPSHCSKILRHELDQLLTILSHKFYVVSPLISLSSMWSFLWLVDSSDASCCHSKPPHSGTDLLPPSLKHCGTPRVHVSPPGGLEWHWDHNIHSPPDSAAVAWLKLESYEGSEGWTQT